MQHSAKSIANGDFKVGQDYSLTDSDQKSLTAAQKDLILVQKQLPHLGNRTSKL